MILKQLIDEDFVNYKKPAMFIGFPTCTFKCERDCGIACCQNSSLALSPNIYIGYHKVIERYLKNPITSAVVLGGLEPMDSWDDLFTFVAAFRAKDSDSDIVIYTGYNREEIENKIALLSYFPNIIVKFGRYIFNQNPHFDEVLGVKLASDNQHGVKIS